MPQRNIHSPLPRKSGEFDSNWTLLQRNFSRDFPQCTNATGNPGTIAAGGPGAASFVTWTQDPNPLRDPFNIIGATPTQNLRIPISGYYDFWMMWHVSDAIGGTTEFRAFMDTANTSDTGFAAPTFTRAINGPSHRFVAGVNIDKYMEALYRSIELEANDMVRFGIQIDAAAALTATTIDHAEFKFTFPIPNSQIQPLGH